MLKYDLEVEAANQYKTNLLKTAVFKLKCYVQLKAETRL
jgi:hypothetical protein